MGEDFLDLAILTRGELLYRRVGLSRLGRPAVTSLGARLAEAAPELSRGSLVLVDSPRSALDVDSSTTPMGRRALAPSARIVDDALRRLFARLGGGRLSMYPTPRAEYFARCVSDPACKPHLSAFGAELLGGLLKKEAGSAARRGGFLFTRFMLAGFAAHAALRARGVRVFECYPDLEFRLWSAGVALAPKSRRREALSGRRRICARLALLAGLSRIEPPRTLDQADATVLALGVAAAIKRGTIIELRNCAEGRFLVAFEGRDRFLKRSLTTPAGARGVANRARLTSSE